MRMTKIAACLLAGVLLPVGLASAATTPDTRASTVWPMTARTQVAQAKTSQGSEQVKTLSPQAPVSMPQPVGAFPTNAVTDRPYVSPEGGVEGYKKTVGALQRTLTELQQLQLQTKEAHWNVSGTLFYSLHELLQDHYEGLSKYADECAERLLAIGSSSDGRASTIVKTSAIPEIPGGYIDDAQVIVWFTNAYKTVGEEVRAGIKDTQDPDPTSSNLLQEIEHGIDKYQWQMRAFVQGTHTDPNTGFDINNNKPVDLPSQPSKIDPNAK
ncbi:DNA starvation/stationary phase protection protein [Lichenihabitans psoromatis]|uniref:Dps family protein n=1 Tax=Lichenihabitans psoromatis TaxID=2528642 RepID=UPI00315D6470